MVEKNIAAANRREDIAWVGEARMRVNRTRHVRRIVEIRPCDSAQLREPREIPHLSAGMNGGWSNSKILREHVDQAGRHRLADHQADHVTELAPMKPLRNRVWKGSTFTPDSPEGLCHQSSGFGGTGLQPCLRVEVRVPEDFERMNLDDLHTRKDRCEIVGDHVGKPDEALLQRGMSRRA